MKLAVETDRIDSEVAFQRSDEGGDTTAGAEPLLRLVTPSHIPFTSSRSLKLPSGGSKERPRRRSCSKAGSETTQQAPTAFRPEPYLCTDQVLNLLGISRPTLYRWMQQGLPVHGQHTGRHLRFRASEIEAWMRGHTSPVESQLSEITG